MSNIDPKIFLFPSTLCGVLVFDSVSRVASSPPPPPASSTHNFVTHHLSHTTLSTTIFHTQLCQPPSVTHRLSHTTLSTTIFHTQLCHTPSFTQLCQPHSTTISHTPSFTYTTCHTPSFTYNFVNHHLSHTTLSTTI